MSETDPSLDQQLSESRGFRRLEFKAVAENPANFNMEVRKNRYTDLDQDGDYRDIKFFLGFCIDGAIPPKSSKPIRSRIPWVIELQLNLQTSQKGKAVGHGIYEVTRIAGKGGFSVHGAVRVEDRQGAVRLGRYMIRCPIVLKRLSSVPLRRSAKASSSRPKSPSPWLTRLKETLELIAESA